jgi:hypothetical protein
MGSCYDISFKYGGLSYENENLYALQILSYFMGTLYFTQCELFQI